MKLLIISAIKDWIVSKFGTEMWTAVAEKLGLGNQTFNAQDIHMTDARFNSFVETILTLASLDMREFKSLFLGYWMTDFAPRVYQSYLKKITTTKEFLVSIIKLNNELCRLLPNDSLAKVELQSLSDSSLTLIYASEKSLVDVVALLRGASTYFNDTYQLKKINAHSVELKFEKK